MKISILTLFPEMFEGPFAHSIIKHAIAKSLVSIDLINIRDFGIGKHKVVDDTPYGGGTGMVMRVDVIHEAIKSVTMPGTKERTILMTASGQPFTQVTARSYTDLDHLIIICGHYEGIDDRIRSFIDEEISVGDFVTTGGELPAMLITDAVVRLLPGVLKPEATQFESFSLTHAKGTPVLEYPQFTRPVTYNGEAVPEVLTSGDHQKIAEWRQEQSEKKTHRVRPDL